MKTVLIVLFLIFNFQIIAEEKDSTLCKYGIIMDFKNVIDEAVGFKYRPLPSVAFFLKGTSSSDKQKVAISAGTLETELNIFKGIIGIEYTILSVDNISFYSVISGGLDIYTDIDARYIDSELHIIGYRKRKNIGYTFETGLGAEYFISKHLSIGGSQTISVNYFKDDLYQPDNRPMQSFQTKWSIVDAKLTLSFYF